MAATTDGGRSWTQIWSGPEQVTYMDFVSPTDGWAVVTQCTPGSGTCSTATLMATTDGGHTWTPRYSTTTGMTCGAHGGLGPISFLNAHQGWMIAWGGSCQGQLLGTTDGGSEWNTINAPCTVPATMQLFAISLVSAEQGFALCGAPIGGGLQASDIVATTNGGQSWSARAFTGFPTAKTPSAIGSVPFVGYPRALAFSSPYDGWMATELAGLWHTTDGGRDWTHAGGTPSASPPPSWTQQAFGVQSVPGGPLLAGVWANSATLVSSSDGGVTWHVLYPPVAPISVQFLGHGVGVGTAPETVGPAILTTADGGSTWRIVHLPSAAGSHAGSEQALFTNPLDGWVLVDNQLWSTNDGGSTWTELGVPLGLPIAQLVETESGNPDLLFRDGSIGPVGAWLSDGPPLPVHSLQIVGRTMWGVGPGQFFGQQPLESADGGKTWVDHTLLYPLSAVSTDFLTPTQGFVLASELPPPSGGSSPPVLLETTDGGQSWTETILPVHLHPSSLDFVSSSQGWMVTSRGLLETTDGGLDWHSVEG